MILNDYECQRCSVTFEWLTHDPDEEVMCPKCGWKSQKVFEKFPYLDVWKPFWCSEIARNPVLIKSRRHFAEELNKRGLFSHGLANSYRAYNPKKWV